MEKKDAQNAAASKYSFLTRAKKDSTVFLPFAEIMYGRHFINRKNFTIICVHANMTPYNDP